jgi:hypothetical protein
MSEPRTSSVGRVPPALRLLRLALRALHWARPRLARAARRSVPAIGRAGRAVGRGLARVGTLARRRRVVLVALACRAAWWSALALLVGAGAALLGFTVETVDDTLWHPFALGLSLCAVVVLVARERHLRWLSTVLGTSHAVLGLLAFGALQG